MVRALIMDALVLASACVKTLADRKMYFGAMSTFRGHGAPYGLHDSLCTLRITVTSFYATLDTGEWPILSRQGLSPCKRYSASWRSQDNKITRIFFGDLIYFYIE